MLIGLPALAACLLLAACERKNSQARQLDRAASQSDPAAAAELHNRADAIRENGSEANVADRGSPAQAAMQSAGNAAAQNPSNAARP
jgi:hypothetical protein